MGPNILIFSDGTGQAGGLLVDENRSNIYKLYRATRVGPDSAVDPRRQLAFYDPGLGSQSDNGQIKRRRQGRRKRHIGSVPPGGSQARFTRSALNAVNLDGQNTGLSATGITGSAASGGSGTALATLPPAMGVNCMMRIA